MPGSLEDRIRELVVDRLFLEAEPSSIGEDERLMDRFGIDSVRLFEIVVGLEEVFGVSFAADEFAPERFSTVRAIAEVVRGKQKAT